MNSSEASSGPRTFIGIMPRETAGAAGCWPFENRVDRKSRARYDMRSRYILADTATVAQIGDREKSSFFSSYRSPSMKLLRHHQPGSRIMVGLGIQRSRDNPGPAAPSNPLLPFRSRRDGRRSDRRALRAAGSFATSKVGHSANRGPGGSLGSPVKWTSDMATILIGLPRRPVVWRLEHAARDVFQVEIFTGINEFMPGERGHHERRLTALKAGEEVCQPIEQAITRNGRACVYQSRVGDCIFPYECVIFI